MYLEIEPIPYGPNRSFASIVFEGETIVCPYHQHPELELVAIDASRGRVVIGDYSGTFREGDLFLIGENIPHIFQNARVGHSGFAKTQVIQFRRDFVGELFFDIPEMLEVRQLLNQSARGLKLTGSGKQPMRALMMAVQEAVGAARILRLIELLQALSNSRSLRCLQRESVVRRIWSDGRMSDIMSYIQENLTYKLDVPSAARRAGLTPNAFCRYFKSQTRRTFTEFVNELRVTEACRLLRETTGSVTEIGYASGFSSLAHFHQEFKKRMKCSPQETRKRFADDRK